MTPVEIIANALEGRTFMTEKKTVGVVAVGDVLVPEQCMTIYIAGTAYHITIGEALE